MTDSEREERTVWKLGQAGFTVKREDGTWIVSDELDEARTDKLAELVEIANAVYEAHWTGQKRKVRPSA
jgi:hypothetical protein